MKKLKTVSVSLPIPFPIIYIRENLCLTAQSKIKERDGTEETLVLALSWLRMTTSPFSASESLLANQCAIIGGEVQESAKQNGHYYARPQSVDSCLPAMMT